jgi:hypothetical protein
VFWLAVWTGASRYIHCDWLRQDRTLAEIFGYEHLPSQSTYSRFSQARNIAVFPQLQRWFFAQLKTGAVTADFDSTVITREGSQEGSAKGCNPHPLYVKYLAPGTNKILNWVTQDQAQLTVQAVSGCSKKLRIRGRLARMQGGQLLRAGPVSRLAAAESGWRQCASRSATPAPGD